ncbi:16S rRNA (adenine1518-N6/adenine1519-N6)-dimethyltransferase [Thermotomaculum hydrothermale]|uniref:16S rRNA (Adenine1518-N6/adenine1519-N6)-dimethyltransferase n=1 Tax=Thermotomaculum hydrothermale TaxID=981385 RepID=A0A7R6SXG7_9BACT|nr:16S rRNA (adenine(1518)-N(6)/adenine(1519)-N(6))-dimethyltransferase RsmA [Thermotomaculum hydrothermale]BBB31769.1 16S rRNA (adenine1518-N6/adenine1519-N6)-dimethyltransferase [Thermotomaculum hydrothermale]
MRKKSLGQHFLTNPQIAEKIVSYLNSGITCVEIGAGEGILTKHLIEKFEKVIVIEKDSELIPFLKDKFKEKCEVINGDVLTDGEKIFSKLESFYVASNLPYNISSPVTILLLKFYKKIPQMVLMYQKEVADKISKEVSLLSCAVYPYYNVKEVLKLKPGAFSPPPKVDSAVLFFERKENILDFNFKKYLNFLKVAFQNRRKVLFKKLMGMMERDRLKVIYLKMNLREDIRIDGMSIEEIFKLYLEVSNEKN